MKLFIKLLKIFVLLIIALTIGSILICMLPNKTIKKNIEKSLPELLEQRNYPKAIIEKKSYQMDNFTDGIFLSQNYHIDPKSPVQSAMLVSIGVYSWDIAETLEQQINSNEFSYRDYPRYWQGNTFLLRILLLLGTFSTIRWLLYVVSSLLICILCVKLYQNVGLPKMLIFMFGLLCVNIFVTQFSMQFFTVIALSMIASILICNKFQSKSGIIPIIFFVIGCLTSYFDLLTAPLLTLGLPLIVFIMLQEQYQQDISWKAGLKGIFLFSVIWAIGFAFTWGAKWAIGTALTEMNVFKDAYENILIRTSTEDYSRFDVIIENVNMLPLVFINIVVLCLALLAIFFFNKKGIKNFVFFLCISIFPYIWFLVLSNHSYLHSWFTYRIQAIAICGILLSLASLISWDKTKKRLNLFLNFGRNKRQINANN